MRLWQKMTKAAVLVGTLTLVAAAHGATLNPPPVWSGSTLIGPARQSVELVKATFTYNADTQRLRFVLGDKWVEMIRGSTSAKANGNAITLPVAPKVLNGTTYVPLKNLFVGLGLDVKPSGNTAWILCTGKVCIRLEVPPKPE